VADLESDLPILSASISGAENASASISGAETPSASISDPGLGEVAELFLAEESVPPRVLAGAIRRLTLVRIRLDTTRVSLAFTRYCFTSKL